MARIDGIIFGYRVFRVAEEDTEALANALLSLGISSRIRNNSCEIRAKDGEKLRKRLEGKVDFSESELLGLPGFIFRNRKRLGTALGLAIAILCIFYSSGRVWDVRVTNADGIDAEGTLSLLEELGLQEGAKWRRIDLDKLEARFLAVSRDVAWININRRGTVAYVTVKEKTNYDEDVDGLGYCNIVAARDGVIEEITVKRGHAVVKPGDVVKAGDLLISGVIPGELGGGFLRAEGTVVARVFDTYSAEVAKISEEKVYVDGQRCELSYKILGFSINILKNSGNLPSGCDIINYKTEAVLFGRYELPIEKSVGIAAIYEIRTRSLTHEEMALSCGAKLRELISTELSGAELIKIRTRGGFTDTGYEMSADVTALFNVAGVAPIEEQ